MQLSPIRLAEYMHNLNRVTTSNGTIFARVNSVRFTQQGKESKTIHRRTDNFETNAFYLGILLDSYTLCIYDQLVTQLYS